MSVVELLAGLAAVLLLAAGREILLDERGGLPSPMAAERGRAAAASLKLGLPGRLERSGLAGRLPLAAVLFAKVAGILIGGVAAWLAAPAAPGRIGLLVAIGMPVAGFLAPDALLERQARSRHRRLLASLPDALDLLAVGSAAGRGPATGLAQIAESGSGPLAEELRMTVAELSCGRPLGGALESLRNRVPGTELATLCASIERSRRLGSPLAAQLRRQSSALRGDQRRAVEERAARAAPKIQLVVALVLVPSVLLMIAAGLLANTDALFRGF